MYGFTFNYTGTKVDHQKEKPLTTEFMQDSILFSISDKKLYSYLKWKTIKYTEEKGIASRLYDLIMGESDKIYGGFFINPLSYTVEMPEADKNMEKMGFKYLGLVQMQRGDDNNYFDYYTRTKKGIFDPISSICSLSLAIYNGFIFAFCKFYSNNFDNYKIIEKILSKNTKTSKKSKKEQEQSDNIDKKVALLDINSNIDEEKIINDDKKEEDNIDDEYENEGDDNEETIRLPKLHFYDFLFNNIYKKKCCSSNKHDLISTCDNIVKKYNSADYIIYHQIILENLLKDYKWNNPKLKDIQSNELIIDLKLLS